MLWGMDVQQIAGIAAGMGAGEHATPLSLACVEFSIDTDIVLAHFLSQLDVESGGFRHTVESLNYSVAGLLATFSRKRISADDCARFGRIKGRAANQVMIANRVYGGEFGRLRLGNLLVGDGWKFRGRGLGQLTGRDNYTRCSRALFADDRLADDPDLVLDPMAGARAAGWHWASHKCRALALRDDLVAVTTAWNGGLNGIDARAAALARAKKLLELP